MKTINLLVSIANNLDEMTKAVKADNNLKSQVKDKMCDQFHIIKQTCLSLACDEANKAIVIE